MMNELLKIQQDMGAPQQHQPRRQTAMHDAEEADSWADPNDGWLICQNLAFITAAIRPIIGCKCSGRYKTAGNGLVIPPEPSFWAIISLLCAGIGLAKKLHINPV